MRAASHLPVPWDTDRQMRLRELLPVRSGLLVVSFSLLAGQGCGVSDRSKRDPGPAPQEDDVQPVEPAMPPVMEDPRVTVLPDVPLGRAWGVKNWMVYYGYWDASMVERLYRYDLVVLDPNSGPPLAEQPAVVARIRAGVDGALGTADDVLLMGYISIGEDLRTFNGAAPVAGDGRGPAHFDPAVGGLVYQNGGIASFYLDERKSDAPRDWGQDGAPDRHGTWGGCYVNVGDPAWQAFVIGADGRSGTPYPAEIILRHSGFDGLFLDTPEVADPWTGYGYTAEGVYQLIRQLDEHYADKLLLLNRGLFFFVPHFPYQYRWSPRKHIDLLLVESHYLDSNYHLGDATAPNSYNLSPFFPLLRSFVNAKVQAEAGRLDNPFPVLSLDYAERPDSFAAEFPDVFGQAVWSSAIDLGRIEFITDRRVTLTPTLMRDHQLPADVNPPRWDSTTAGYTHFHDQPRFYMALGYEDWETRAPRVGIQQAVAGNGQVTVRWDVAEDQTRPVKYNVYYSTTSPINFDTAKVIGNVRPSVGAGYAEGRGYNSQDSACPYETTITGLKNGTTYYFAVRAEDATRGATPAAGGRTGPGGGIEETNTSEIAATPAAQ
jgi:hypothetical protein